MLFRSIRSISVCETEHSTYYRLNGAIYIQTVDLLMQGGDLYGDESYAYVMEKEHSVDIDDEMDFMFAEVMIRKLK